MVEALYTHEHRTKNKGQNDSEKDFFKLINSFVFKKIMGNTRNHRDVQLVTIDKQRNHLVQELNYHTTKCFLEKVVAIQTNKINVKINKPVYLGLSDMAIKKIDLYKYWYDYSKPEHRQNCKLITWIQTPL